MTIQRKHIQAKKAHAHSLIQAGRLVEAKAIFAEICKLSKGDADAWFLLGAIQGQLGMFDEAAKSFKRSIDICPSAEAYDNLGLAHLSSRRLKLAESSFRQALKLNPAYARAHFNLGLVYKDQGDLDSGLASFRHAAKLQPDYFEAIANQGLLLMQEGHYQEALPHLQSAIRLNPLSAEIHNRIGLIFLSLKQSAKASESFKKAIELAPSMPAAWSNLGDAQLAQDQFEAALDSFRRALKLLPDDVSLLIRAGEIFHYLGKEDLGVDCFQKALIREPRNYDIYLKLAEVLVVQMKFDDAAECYRRVLDASPGHPEAVAGLAMAYERRGDPARAYHTISPLLEAPEVSPAVAIALGMVSKHAGLQESAISLIEGVLRRDLDKSVRQRLYYTLARLYENTSDYDRAFENYRLANEMVQHALAMDLHVEHVTNLISTYTESFMADAPHSSTPSDRAIFIIGMPRSGTSLVEQILASHPSVFGAGELLDIFGSAAAIGTINAGSLSSENRLLLSEQIEQHAKSYSEHLTNLSCNALRITNKTPTNFLLLGLIELLCPNARVIHCVRDPLDTCVSCFFQNFGGRHTYSSRLDYLGRYYREYKRLMAHWEDVISLPILEVRYEDLVDDQEKWSRALVEFCGLEWDESCLHFYKSKRIINTASYEQVRNPIYRSSVGRWKPFEKHLGPLMSALEGH